MTKEREIIQNIRENMEKAIVGKGRVVDLVLTALICRGHVLIEDVPGVGKIGRASCRERV